MEPTLFSNARSKVKRADEHIDELNRVLDLFLQTAFYRFGVEKRADTSQFLLKYQITTAVPRDDIALILGDVIHNLRAALDHMIWELVSRCNGTPTGELYFPVCETRAKLKKAINNGQIKVLGADIADLILNYIKPYKRGNNLLFALHSLDIIDKHRLLIPVFSIVSLPGVTGQMGGITIEDCTFTVQEGGTFIFIAVSEEVMFRGIEKPIFNIVFAQGQPMEGELLVPTLKQMSLLVSGIMNAVESVCSAGIQ